MGKEFEVTIEYSDTPADWDAFIKIMVSKFKQWQKGREDGDD